MVPPTYISAIISTLSWVFTLIRLYSIKPVRCIKLFGMTGDLKPTAGRAFEAEPSEPSDNLLTRPFFTPGIYFYKFFTPGIYFYKFFTRDTCSSWGFLLTYPFFNPDIYSYKFVTPNIYSRQNWGLRGFSFNCCPISSHSLDFCCRFSTEY